MWGIIIKKQLVLIKCVTQQTNDGDTIILLSYRCPPQALTSYQIQ